MKKKILFISIIIVVFIGIGVSCFFLLKDSTKDKDVKEVKTLSKLDKYGISLDENDTELYKKEYEILKANLDSKDINKEEYAKSIAKLFIIDLYTISNKLNKYDVGGTEFVFKGGIKNYTLNVTDTIYKYVEDNALGKRKQNLPEVISIECLNIKKDKFTIKEKDENDKEINGKTYDAYIINLSWTYKVDLGYDKEAKVIVINDNDKMYVVEKD